MAARPNGKRIWTPNHSTGNIRARRFPFAPQVSAPYTPPTRLPAPRRTVTELDDSILAELRAKIKEWEIEADRLEFGKKESAIVSLEDQLAQLLCKDFISKARLREQSALWDPRGDGNITRGDFRLHLKRLELKPKNVHEVDGLFASWDKDRSGSISIDELGDSLKALHAEYKRRMEDKQTPAIKQKIVDLRARVMVAKSVTLAAERVDKLTTELAELSQVIEARIDVQLGRLITSRGINIGEVVGSWPKMRNADKKHARELSRSDFKTEVSKLGLMQHGQPATSKALGQLFDSVDLNRNGWLDVKEATKALKVWQGYSSAAYGDKHAKEAQLTQQKKRAVKKLQYALREPSREAEKPPPSPGRYDEHELEGGMLSPMRTPFSGGSTGNVTGRSTHGNMTARTTGNMTGRSAAPLTGRSAAPMTGRSESPLLDSQVSRGRARFGTAPAVEKVAGALAGNGLPPQAVQQDSRTPQQKEAARAGAQAAFAKVRTKTLGRGFVTWAGHYKQACHLRKARSSITNAVMLRGWKQWVQICMESKKKRMLEEAAHGLVGGWRDLTQRTTIAAWRTWTRFLRRRANLLAMEQHLWKVAAPMRQKQMLFAFDLWGARRAATRQMQLSLNTTSIATYAPAAAAPACAPAAALVAAPAATPAAAPAAAPSNGPLGWLFSTFFGPSSDNASSKGPPSPSKMDPDLKAATRARNLEKATSAASPRVKLKAAQAFANKRAAEVEAEKAAEAAEVAAEAEMQLAETMAAAAKVKAEARAKLAKLENPSEVPSPDMPTKRRRSSSPPPPPPRSTSPIDGNLVASYPLNARPVTSSQDSSSTSPPAGLLATATRHARWLEGLVVTLGPERPTYDAELDLSC